MEPVTTLLTQYSIEGIIIFIVLLAVAGKAIFELWDFFKRKFKEYFKKEEEVENLGTNWENQFDRLNNRFEELNVRLDKFDNDFQETKERLSFVEERLQENTRSYLIDAHHKFCYEIKAIDDINLQSVERRYMYYKTAGGNSFIDGLVKEIRQLPRVTLQNRILSND